MIDWLKRRKWVVGAFASAVLVLGVGAYIGMSARGAAPKADAPPPLQFLASQVTQPQMRRMAYDLGLPGTVQAMSQATVRSKLSAVLQAVHVREGDTVTEGQVLAEFDTAALKAQLAEREAGVALARANLEQAQRTREANAQLVKQNFITQNAFDVADATYQTQAASLAAAKAQLAQTQLQLDDAVVRAPIAGQVSRRYVQPGEKVAADAQLLGIVNLVRLEVQAQAAAADVARVTPGAAADVVVEGLSAQHLRGRVERINPSADPGSRTIDLYVSFPNPQGLVRAGMFANVHLNLAADRETLTLPLTAIQSEAGQSVVWSVRNGRLARRVVSVGRRDGAGQLAEILGGVDSGDVVLATRFDDLRDGALAQVGAPPPATKATVHGDGGSAAGAVLAAGS